MKIILSGGTGFIGRPLLVQLLRADHHVTLLSRNPDRLGLQTRPSIDTVPWDACNSGPWSSRVDGADAVINLAGEPIAQKRWTREQKERIVSSRIDSTRALVEAIRRAQKKPAVLINASAVGYYGHVESGEVTESRPKGNGFLADTCAQWEKEALAAEALGVRVVCLRTGIVLEKGGGALAKMLPPFRFFMGGPLGSGCQGLPWVHRDDEIGAILFTLKTQNLRGPVNITAPNPVTMREFCESLGKAMRRPSWAPVPAFVLRLLLGDMAEEMLLGGQRAVPQKLLDAGYRFRYPDLDRALAAILSQP